MDDDADEHEDFGQKFIGVNMGGTLEIHGKDKKSWSQLTKTVVPHQIRSTFYCSYCQTDSISLTYIKIAASHWKTSPPTLGLLCMSLTETLESSFSRVIP